MSGADVMELGRDALMTLLIVCTPLLVVAMFVGVVISLLQAVTQVQEMTLTFVPKIVAMILASVIAFPFMGQKIGAFSQRIAQVIVGFGGG